MPPVSGLTGLLCRFQSGVISDYVAWIVFGLACLGAPSPWCCGDIPSIDHAIMALASGG